MLVLYVLKMTPRTLAIMSLTSLATNNLIAIRRRGGSTLDLIWATINLCPQVVLINVSFTDIKLIYFRYHNQFLKRVKKEGFVCTIFTLLWQSNKGLRAIKW